MFQHQRVVLFFDSLPNTQKSTLYCWKPSSRTLNRLQDQAMTRLKNNAGTLADKEALSHLALAS